MKTVADEISEYLTYGMHHSTPQAKEAIMAIINRSKFAGIDADIDKHPIMRHNKHLQKHEV